MKGIITRKKWPTLRVSVLVFLSESQQINGPPSVTLVTIEPYDGSCIAISTTQSYSLTSLFLHLYGRIVYQQGCMSIDLLMVPLWWVHRQASRMFSRQLFFDVRWCLLIYRAMWWVRENKCSNRKWHHWWADCRAALALAVRRERGSCGELRLIQTVPEMGHV